MYKQKSNLTILHLDVTCAVLGAESPVQHLQGVAHLVRTVRHLRGTRGVVASHRRRWVAVVTPLATTLTGNRKFKKKL